MAIINEPKKSISIGVTPTLLNKVDAEAVQLGMTRSAFFSMCVNTYFRNMEAMEVLNRANDLFEEAKKLQEQNQINLWNVEASAKN